MYYFKFKNTDPFRFNHFIPTHFLYEQCTCFCTSKNHACEDIDERQVYHILSQKYFDIIVTPGYSFEASHLISL